MKNNPKKSFGNTANKLKLIYKLGIMLVIIGVILGLFQQFFISILLIFLGVGLALPSAWLDLKKSKEEKNKAGNVHAFIGFIELLAAIVVCLYILYILFFS